MIYNKIKKFMKVMDYQVKFASSSRKKQIKYASSAYVISVVAIIVLRIVQKTTGNDYLENTAFKSKFLAELCGESGNYSWWPITHFILYLVLGILCPDIWLYLFVLGIIWELFEWAGGIFLCKHDKFSEKIVNKNLMKKIESKKQYGEEWVAGKFSDLFFNGAGLALGLGIRKVYDSSKAKKKDDS